MCVFILRLLGAALSSEFKIYQADFTDWMCFQQPNLMEEISRNLE